MSQRSFWFTCRGQWGKAPLFGGKTASRTKRTCSFDAIRHDVEGDCTRHDMTKVTMCYGVQRRQEVIGNNRIVHCSYVELARHLPGECPHCEYREVNP